MARRDRAIHGYRAHGDDVGGQQQSVWSLGCRVHSSVGILTFDSGDFDASAIKLPHPENIVVEERRTEAANSETSASSTFAPEIRPPGQADEVPILGGKAPWLSDWWDTHSENVQETPKEKVSHPIASALIVCRSVLSVGDANSRKS